MTKDLFSIELSMSSRELLKKINLHASALDLTNSMSSIGGSYRKEVKLIFGRKQVRQTSLRWAALKPKTLAEKQKLGFSNKGILERTGELQGGMTSKNHPDNISQTGKDFGRFGSSNEYGDFHDDTKSTRKKLPLRNFSIPSESTFGTFLRIIDEDIINQLEHIGINVT